MKKHTLLLLLLVMMVNHLFAQEPDYFAAAKAGLSLRESPATSAKALTKIPYGAKLQILRDSVAAVLISTEGFSGAWWKVQYDKQVGYVVSSYLLPWAPPKTGIKDFKTYFAQISSLAGLPLVVKSGNEEMPMQLTKQLYKNGAEWHEFQGYEYGSEAFFFPELNIEQVFLLLRLVGQYKDQVGENTAFPTKNSSSKTTIGQRAVKVQREDWGNGKTGPIERIKIEQDEAVITTLEIFMLDNQVVVYWSSGV